MYHPKTEGLLPFKSLVAESNDGGRTWAKCRVVPLGSYTTAALCGPIMVLRDGSWAFPCENWKEYLDPDPPVHKVLLVFSRDQGRTWNPVIVAQTTETKRVYYWDQRLAPLRDGRILAHFWTYDAVANRDLCIHQSVSPDGGRTWPEPQSTGIDGQISAPLELSDGRLFIAYVKRFVEPSIRARISGDGGRSWGDEVILYTKELPEPGEKGSTTSRDTLDAMMLWTFGNPNVALLSKNEVLVVHYAGSSQITAIHCVRVAV
jgi:hypothetical protein